MGRKKKVVTETPVSQEETKETKTTEKTNVSSSVATIGYQGNLNIKVQRGNKIISNKTYHNTGSQLLFRFLCECLAGNYYEDLRPVKIKLFSGHDTEKINEPNTWINEDTESATPLSITYSNVATVEESLSSNEYSVSYEFKVPYTYIIRSVYKAAIYSGNETDNTHWSAIFGFIEDGAWDPIIISSADQQYYTLVLTWTMTISNQGGSN